MLKSPICTLIFLAAFYLMQFGLFWSEFIQMSRWQWNSSIDLIDYQSNFPIALNCIESYATHIHPVNLPKLLILVENKSMKK